jgi:hypothetical protein
MSEDRPWPPNYADPIRLRIRLPTQAHPAPATPAELKARPGTFHHPTQGKLVEILRRIGYGPSSPSKPALPLARSHPSAASEAAPTRVLAASWEPSVLLPSNHSRPGVDGEQPRQEGPLGDFHQASTRNPEPAARMLGLDRNVFSDMLHEFKQFHGLRPGDNVTFEDDGSIYFNGGYVGNLLEHGN